MTRQRNVPVDNDAIYINTKDKFSFPYLENKQNV